MFPATTWEREASLVILLLKPHKEVAMILRLDPGPFNATGSLFSKMMVTIILLFVAALLYLSAPANDHHSFGGRTHSAAFPAE